jgi:alpha-amylase
MGSDHFYLDDNKNRSNTQQAVYKNYIPTVEMVERLCEKWRERFAVSISISGAALEQMREFSPLMIDRLRQLTRYEQIEWIAETHPHSLSSLFDRNEFATQVENYRKLLREILGVESETFRNTDLIYTPTIGSWVSQLGFRAMLIGTAPISRLYCSSLHPETRLLPYSLWEGINAMNKTIEKSKENLYCTTIYAEDIMQTNRPEYERLLNKLAQNEAINLTTPRVVVSNAAPSEVIELAAIQPHTWSQNELQQEAITQLYNLKEQVKQLNNKNLTNAWRLLQSVDNFKPMSLDLTEENPYGTPYEAFINYMNVLGDFRLMLKNIR